MLRAAGDQLELGFSFCLVRQLLEPALVALPADEQQNALAGGARHAAELIGQAPDGAVGADAEIYAYLDALVELIPRLSAHCPLALLVDDAQWADSSSVRFLAFLTRRLARVRVLAIVAVRRDDASASNALIEHLVGIDTAQLLTLGPLSVVGASAMLATVLKDTVAEPFAVACHTATGGIPFFLGEQLSSSFRKLQVSSRKELPTSL